MPELNPEIINTIADSFTKDGIESELAKGAAVVAFHAAMSFVNDKAYKLCERSQGCRECNPLVDDDLDA